MERTQTSRRGQPLVALCLIIVMWSAARMTLWRGDATSPELPAAVQALAAGPTLLNVGDHSGALLPAIVTEAGHARSTIVEKVIFQQAGLAADPVPSFRPDVIRLGPAHFLLRSNPALTTPRRAGILGERPPAAPAATSPSVAATDDPRWSGDNWLLMRAGSGAAAQAPGAASYGASQAGAVVRYRLGRGDLHESYGYLRTSLAINAPGKDKEVALGFGFRPVSRLPLRVLAEARLQDTKGSAMQVRPVATVVTELMPQRLPLGLTAEAYGQAGYAGGRGATAFYDVQAVIERALPRIGGRDRDLRLGAGVWSGGQEGAVRLDVGPRASFRLDLGGANPARVVLDWRFRAAGNARPGSGPALTVASSF